MNISPISYAYRTQNYSFGKSIKKSLDNNEKTVDNDSKAKAEMYNNSPFTVKIIVLATLLMSLLIPKSLPQQKTNSKNNVTVPLSAISDVYKPSVDAMAVSSFDYLQENINNLQQLLNSQISEDTEIDNAQKTIDALYKKQNEQNQVATAYTNGEYVYLHININQDDEEIKDKYEFGINIESLKKLFDIEDGGIENNNELKVRDDAYGKYGDGTYKDYTQNWFHNGDIIKVPISSIKLDNVNLTGYFED